jgi:hypothetical protein
MISAGNKKDCIRVRNLPVECGIEQILEFLGVHSQHIVRDYAHCYYLKNALFFLGSTRCSYGV